MKKGRFSRLAKGNCPPSGRFVPNRVLETSWCGRSERPVLAVGQGELPPVWPVRAKSGAGNLLAWAIGKAGSRGWPRGIAPRLAGSCQIGCWKPLGVGDRKGRFSRLAKGNCPPSGRFLPNRVLETSWRGRSERPVLAVGQGELPPTLAGSSPIGCWKPLGVGDRKGRFSRL
ncbi:hypothetical protein, partial [Kamptonema formosum]|uniref:hypothetical protein n=1 Tax=Kamptonema formosum TaxID=331992 RepID=UPI0018E23C4A